MTDSELAPSTATIVTRWAGRVSVVVAIVVFLIGFVGVVRGSEVDLLLCMGALAIFTLGIGLLAAARR